MSVPTRALKSPKIMIMSVGEMIVHYRNPPMAGWLQMLRRQG